MNLFSKNTSLKKVICVFLFIFFSHSLAFGLEFKTEFSAKNIKITNEFSAFFSDIFDKDAETDKDLFFFTANFLSIFIEYFTSFQVFEISYLFIKEIPFNQFSIPPPSIS